MITNDRWVAAISPHTGEWVVRESDDTSAEPQCVAVVCDSDGRGEERANVLAAAPDMLTALRLLREQVYGDALDMVNVVIAKAERGVISADEGGNV